MSQEEWLPRKTRGDVEGAATDEQRVSSIELFFDLVFVFTLTQLTALLERELSPESGVQAVLIFVVLFGCTTAMCG